MALTSFFITFLASALPTALAGYPTLGMPINPNGDQSKCLGVVGGNMYNGAQVDIYDCNDSDSQKWYMHYGTTHVLTAYGNYCLDAGLPPFENNRVLTIWECYEDLPQQTWEWSENDTTVTLHNQGKCMDLTNGSKDNRNLIQIYDCYPGNTNQMWTHTNIVLSDPSGGHPSDGNNTSCNGPKGYYCQGGPPPDSITTFPPDAITTFPPDAITTFPPDSITTWSSTSTPSFAPTVANVAGNAAVNSVSGALEGSSESSGSSDGFAKWAPVVVGLLAANLVVALALIVLSVMNYRRNSKGGLYRSIETS